MYTVKEHELIKKKYKMIATSFQWSQTKFIQTKIWGRKKNFVLFAKFIVKFFFLVSMVYLLRRLVITYLPINFSNTLILVLHVGNTQMTTSKSLQNRLIHTTSNSMRICSLSFILICPSPIPCSLSAFHRFVCLINKIGTCSLGATRNSHAHNNVWHLIDIERNRKERRKTRSRDRVCCARMCRIDAKIIDKIEVRRGNNAHAAMCEQQKQ